jgi:hypothetical protein
MQWRFLPVLGEKVTFLNLYITNMVNINNKVLQKVQMPQAYSKMHGQTFSSTRNETGSRSTDAQAFTSIHEIQFRKKHITGMALILCSWAISHCHVGLGPFHYKSLRLPFMAYLSP